MLGLTKKKTGLMIGLMGVIALVPMATHCGLKKFDARSAVSRASKTSDGNQSQDTSPSPAEITTKPNGTPQPSSLLECADLTAEDILDEDIPQNEIEDLCSVLTLLDFKGNPSNDQSAAIDFFD